MGDSSTAALPPDVRLRPWAGDADLAPVVAFLRDCALADGLPFTWTAGIFTDEVLGWAGMDPARDLVLAARGEEIVGAVWINATKREGAWQLQHDGFVAPTLRRRGIGGALLAAIATRAAELGASLPDPELPRRLTVVTNDPNAGENAMIRAAGYEPYRWYALLARDLTRPLPEPQPVAGLALRPVVPEQYRAIFTGLDEAFRDHFGHRDWTDDDFAVLFHGSDVDTSLWRVAWDGDELAGASHNTIVAQEAVDLGIRQGWVDIIGVRRPWRGRGVARWLLAETMAEYARRGMERAILGVDLDNPTGALGLYESVGFAPVLRSTMWARILPRGTGR